MTTIELDGLQNDLERSIAIFEAGKKQLFRQDGTPKYAPQEHKEREAELMAPVQQAADRARAASDEARQQADHEDTLADFDPLLSLASTKQDTVMVKQSIIAPTVESEELPALARRLTAVMNHGDEIDKRLYALHTQKRLDALRRAGQQRGTMDSPGKVTVPDGFGVVADALRKLQETLTDPDTQKKLAAAKARRQRAEELSIHVTRRLNDVTGRTEQFKKEYAERVRSWA